MKLGTALLAAGLVAASGTVIFFSCGPQKTKSDASGTSTATTSAGGTQTTQTISDVSQPSTLAITTGSVTLPAGSMDKGSSATLTAATAPAQFKTNTDVTPAGGAVNLAGTDASGKPLAQAKAPMTVALDIDPAAAGLAPVDKTAANLCVFGFGVDQVLRVWRNALLTVNGNKLTIPSLWFGIFQIYYCGTATIAGAVDVAAGGATAGPAAPAGPGGTVAAGAGGFYANCDDSAEKDNNNGDNAGVCIEYVGTAFGISGVLTGLQGKCTGTWTAGAGCKLASPLGICVFSYGTTSEMAYVASSTNPPAPGTHDGIKASCLAQTNPGGAGGTAAWFEPGTYTPTPGASQTTPTVTGTSTSTGTGTGTGTPAATGTPCDPSVTGCFIAVASQCQFVKGQTTATCTMSGGTACPSTGRLGCCHSPSVDIAMYSNNGLSASAAETSCTSGGGSWTAP